MLNKVMFLIIISIASLGFFFISQQNQDKSSIEIDKAMLYKLVQTLGYQVDNSNFTHTLGNSMYKHDSMKMLIKTDHTSEEVQNLLNDKDISYIIPKTIYGDFYPNYWLIDYEGRQILATLQSEPNHLGTESSFTTKNMRFIKFNLDRLDRLNRNE